MDEEKPLTALGAGGTTTQSFWFYIMIFYARNEDDSLFFKMSVVLLFVVVLGSVLVLVLLAVVEISQHSNSFGGFYFVVADELAVVEGDQGKHLKHLFLAVVGVHVLGCYFVFVDVAANNPVATRWHQTDTLCDSAEQILVYEHCSLGCLLLGLYFWSFRFFLGLYCCRGTFVTKNIVLFVLLFR